MLAPDPRSNLAHSSDQGRTFSARQFVSGTTLDPAQPSLAGGDGRLALVFHARDEQSGGRAGVYYREIDSDGSLSRLVRAYETESVNFPSAALGSKGRIFLSWASTMDGASNGYFLQSRALLSSQAVRAAGGQRVLTPPTFRGRRH